MCSKLLIDLNSLRLLIHPAQSVLYTNITKLEYARVFIFMHLLGYFLHILNLLPFVYMYIKHP
jgi:hypothetical protein